MQPKTRTIIALDALGLAAVAALFVLWCVHTPGAARHCLPPWGCGSCPRGCASGSGRTPRRPLSPHKNRRT